MSQLKKNAPTGANTGDNAASPPREDQAWTAEPTIGDPRPGHWVRSLFLMGIAFLVIISALQWADVVEWVNGEWRLKPKRETERDKQIEKINDAEQYALLSNTPGYYECLHCPTGRIYLNAGEVWKYGVTNQGEKQRYNAQFLRQRLLRYVIQLKGTYSQCLVEEKRKLFDYPLLPENLIRPDSLKLVLPPGNLQTR